jgi:hypothetical protein
MKIKNNSTLEHSSKCHCVRNPFSSLYFWEVAKMKNLLNVLAVLITATLMPGLGGCEKRCKTDEKQPPASCSTPADKTVSRDECPPDEKYTSDECRTPYNKQFDRMTHNAELADMSLTDLHFVPNRPILNSNGTRRLNHLAWMVDQYGGSIMFDTAEPKSEMAQARLQTICRFLQKWGLSNQKIVVCLGLPMSRGMTADEAVKIYQDTRFKPGEKEKDTKAQPAFVQ